MVVCLANSPLFKSYNSAILPGVIPANHEGIPPIKDPEKDFLLSGVLSEEIAQLSLVLKTFSQLPECDLYITGNKGDENLLKEYSEKYSNIHWCGQLAFPRYMELLHKIKWLAPIRLACDSKAMMPIIKEAADLLRGAGCKPHRLFSYVLLTDLEDSLERINFLRQIDIMPFAQPYRDFTPNQIIPQWQKDLAHWTNRRELLTSCAFKDFQPRRGFYCSEYFK